MYIASLTCAVMASRLPVISADAIAPLSPGKRRADAGVDRVTDALHGRGIAQPQPGLHRRLGDADRAERKAGRADALKVEIAGEVVAAGTQAVRAAD